MSAADAFPVISLARLQSGEEAGEAELSALRKALTEHGFFYLSEHGIAQDLIDTVYEQQEIFFARPREEKAIGIDRTLNLGWTPVGQERLNTRRVGNVGDLKESFYIADGILTRTQTLPPSLEAARPDLELLWTESRRVVLQVLAAFARVLGVPHDLFESHHTGGLDRLRLIHYPPAPLSVHQSEEGDIRASEHTDYGSCTLLFQKNVGGLQVKLRSTTTSASESTSTPPAAAEPEAIWVDVPPKPGCLVINVADAMEFWTAGQLRSTVHRVRLPSVEHEAGQSRYSIAFFAQPDEATLLDPSVLQHAASVPPSPEQREEQRAVLTRLLRAKDIPLRADQAPPTGGEYLRLRLRATYGSIRS